MCCFCELLLYIYGGVNNHWTIVLFSVVDFFSVSGKPTFTKTLFRKNTVELEWTATHMDKSSFTLRIKPYNMESQEVDVFKNTSYVLLDALRFPSYRIQVLQYTPNESCRYSDPLQYIPRTYESRQNMCISTGDAYSSGHLVLSHLGLAFVLMLRPFFPELVMSTDLLSFEHPSVLLFCSVILSSDHDLSFGVKVIIFHCSLVIQMLLTCHVFIV